MNAWKQWTSLERIIMIIAVIILLAILAAFGPVAFAGVPCSGISFCWCEG